MLNRLVMKYLKKIGYGAAAIIIGSVATLLIQSWIDRPQLFVAVEEVGFVGSDDYVEVGDLLRNLSEDDRWVWKFREIRQVVGAQRSIRKCSHEKGSS